MRRGAESDPLSLSVVLDTNVVVRADFNVSMGSLDVLAERSRSGDVTLVVPEVAIRESVGQFQKKLKKFGAELETRAQRVGRMLRAVGEPARFPE